MAKKSESVYVTFRKKGDEFVGHSLSSKKPNQEDFARWENPPAERASTRKTPDSDSPPKGQFAAVIRTFHSVMDTYRNLVATTISVSPMLAGVMANRALGDFVAKNGTELGDLTNDDFSVFELRPQHFPTLIRRHEQAVAAVNGAEHLPEIATIGLISVFDAHLSKLLKTVFRLRSDMVFTSDREIKYSDLAKFESLDEAREHIIEKDAETIIRHSHHDQFTIMEKKFSVPLTKDLNSWPLFIELCERRNLLTHTGGIVSQQYITNCTAHGYKTEIKVGDELTTDSEYFNNAVRITSEIGIKLAHVLWRKFAPDEREAADADLNERSYRLISAREYELAERLLDFGVNTIKTHSSESKKLMMLINLANAIKLQNRKEEAKKLVDEVDWSAKSYMFRVGACAIEDKIDEICEIMILIGKSGEVSSVDYREWPLFRNIRKSDKFKETFEKIFGEPLVVDQKKLEISNSSDEPLSLGSRQETRVRKRPAQTKH